MNYLSYEEITRHKKSVIASKEERIENRLDDKFTQWIGDNTDRNVRTIDGKNTFHGMGIIALETRTRKQEPSECVRILRLRSLLKAKNITELKNFPIKWYEPDDLRGLSKITLKPVMQLIQPLVSSSSGIDILWQSSLLFTKEENCPAGMASSRNISMVNRIVKVRYLYFLLSTCLRLMKIAYILPCFSALIKHKHCI